MTELLAELREWLLIYNVQAFLRVIREGESRQDDLAYQIRWGGLGKKPVVFDDLSNHPRIYEPTTGGLKSSAAGAYQATYTTWSEFLKAVGPRDFGKESQDLFAVWCIRRAKAIDAVIYGRFDEACRLCAGTWTSLPGGVEENAATKRARQTYIKWGGTFADAAPKSLPTTEPPMALPLIPIFAAVLPELVKLIPVLGSKFGSGSEVSNRNIAAATAIADAVTSATQSPNLQAAVEAMQSDPAMLKAAQAAVYDVLPTLSEAGGGGIDGARKMAAEAAGKGIDSLWQPTFILALLFFLLIAFVVVTSMLNLSWVATITAETRSMVIGFVMGTVAGSVLAFYYGTTQSSQRKTDLIGK